MDLVSKIEEAIIENNTTLKETVSKKRKDDKSDDPIGQAMAARNNAGGLSVVIT